MTSLEKFFLFLRRLLARPEERDQLSSGLRSARIRQWVIGRCSKESGHLLEVGCGEGLLLGGLRSSALSVTGVDLDLESLRKAKRTVQKGGPVIRLLQADARRLPFADRRFDRVVCVNVLLSFASSEMIQESLREMKRACRSGGKVLLEFRNRLNPWTFLSYRWVRLYDPTCQTPLLSFSKERIFSLLEEAGLRVLHFVPLEPFLGPAASAFLVEAIPSDRPMPTFGAFQQCLMRLRSLLRNVRFLRLLRDRTLLSAVQIKRSGAHPPGAPLPRDPLSIGLIGAGRQGRGILLPALSHLKGVKVSAVCVRTAASQERLLKRGAVRCVRDYRQILQDKTVQAVMIATPSSLQADLVVESLRCGKDVFCEAPGITSLKDWEKVARALEGSDRILQYGFRFFFTPIYQKLKELIRREGPQKKRFFRFTYPERYHFDSLAFFLNGPIDTVACHRQGGLLSFWLTFRNGDEALLEPCPMTFQKVFSLEKVSVTDIEGEWVVERGVLLKERRYNRETLLEATPEISFSEDSALTSEPPKEFLTQKGYLPELTSFVEALRRRQPSHCTLQDALEVFRIDQALSRTLLFGRKESL